MNIWDIPFPHCDQKVWSEKSKEEKIRIWEMQYVINGNFYVLESSPFHCLSEVNIPENFIKSLRYGDDKELYSLIHYLIFYVKKTSKYFPLFPIVFEHLDMIVTHPRFEDNLNLKSFVKFKKIVKNLEG